MNWLNWLKPGRGASAAGDDVFKRIYAKRAWKGRESVSGRGSDFDQTSALRQGLPTLLRDLEVRHILDVPCGDFNWMRKVVEATPDLAYIGGDIVKEIVDSNTAAYGKPGVEFRHLDLLRDSLPTADLLFCRDCLVHLSESDIRAALANIAAASFSYVALTTFTQRKRNRDIRTGRWRPINFQVAPFSLPAPLRLIVEECTEENGRFSDKAMGVWRTADIRRWAAHG